MPVADFRVRKQNVAFAEVLLLSSGLVLAGWASIPALSQQPQVGFIVSQGPKSLADVAAITGALGRRLFKNRETLNISEESYAIAQNRYRGGLSTSLNVLSTEDLLIADERAVADPKTRAFALDIALVRALGGEFRS